MKKMLLALLVVFSACSVADAQLFRRRADVQVNVFGGGAQAVRGPAAVRVAQPQRQRTGFLSRRQTVVNVNSGFVPQQVQQVQYQQVQRVQVQHVQQLNQLNTYSHNLVAPAQIRFVRQNAVYLTAPQAIQVQSYAMPAQVVQRVQQQVVADPCPPEQQAAAPAEAQYVTQPQQVVERQVVVPQQVVYQPQAIAAPVYVQAQRVVQTRQYVTAGCY